MKDFFPRFYSFCVSENNYILKQLSSHHSPLKKAHKKHDINKHTTSSSLSPLSLSLERDDDDDDDERAGVGAAIKRIYPHSESSEKDPPIFDQKKHSGVTNERKKNASANKKNNTK